MEQQLKSRDDNQRRAQHLRDDAARLRAQPADSAEQRDYLDHFAAERDQEADEIDHYIGLGDIDA